MPHQCTNCGRTFPDGSKEMLSGCPDCGGNKFQFTPSRSSTSDGSADAEPGADEPAGGSDGEDDAGWGSESGFTKATETVRNWVTSSDDEASSVIDDGSPTAPDDELPTATDAEEPASATDAEEPASATDTDQSIASSASADSTPTTESSRSPTSESRRSTSTQSEQSDPHARASQSWPSSESKPIDESTAASSEFTEWPETARRPEDRSASTESDDRSESTRETDRSTADRSSAQSPPTRVSDDESANDRTPTRTPIAESEDSAQADARSGVVSNDDIPTGTVEGKTGSDRDDGADTAPTVTDTDRPHSDAEQSPDHGRVVSEPTGEQPSMEELRAELNEQFESIKIVSPGQYELNLMELYNREEYIISLQEDGRYVIDVPDSWHENEE